jgi:acetyltransferase-like isoleucine patch superfamily enzyme
MKSTRLYLAMILFRILPETRGFCLKARLMRWCGAKVGKNVRICSSAIFMGPGDVQIGDDTWIGQQVTIITSASIRIGSHIGPHVLIVTGTHEIDPQGPHTAGPGKNLDVTIEDGVWLGARCTILPGVTVGTKAAVAAGAVVTHDVPSRTLSAGVPSITKRTLAIQERCS